MLNPVILSFVTFLALFVLIGVYAASRKASTTEDYLLASRSIGPWFMALSAVSTNNSGFMFIGLVGMTYTLGLSAIWIMVGWIFGDYLMWFWIHRRLREESEAENVRTIPSFLAAELPSGGAAGEGHGGRHHDPLPGDLRGGAAQRGKQGIARALRLGLRGRSGRGGLHCRDLLLRGRHPGVDLDGLCAVDQHDRGNVASAGDRHRRNRRYR